MNLSPTGIDRNLTHYADPGFSRYIRRAFLASAGYDEADLRAPRRRHRRYLVRLHHLPSRHAPTRRSRQTRRARSGRAAPRLSNPFPRRNPPLPHRHALPQPHGHGNRGNDRRPAHGRGRAARRLRQNPASPTHGRSFRVRARHPPRRRANAGRRLARRALGRMHGLSPLLGAAPSWCARRRRNSRCRAEPVPNRRNLHGHGHGLNHGLRDRSPRANAAGRSHPTRSLRPALRDSESPQAAGP